jgi:hypothetical protein
MQVRRRQNAQTSNFVVVGLLRSCHVALLANLTVFPGNGEGCEFINNSPAQFEATKLRTGKLFFAEN